MELRSKVMGEELAHTLLVTAVLEVHVRHKTLRFCVTIWAFQKHSKVVESAYVILSDVNNEAGISLLLNSNFTSFLLRSNLDSRFGDLYLFFVQVRSDFNCSMHALLDAIYGFCYILLNVLLILMIIFVLFLLVDYDLHFLLVVGLCLASAIRHARLAKV